MKMSPDSRLYTNAVLTVIAVLLLALVANAYRVSFVSEATAQSPSSAFSSGRTASPEPDVNVSQTQDLAVAAATREVADANREVASAIRELAKQMDPIAKAIGSIQINTGGAAGTAAPGTAGSAVELTPATPR
ncbi:MAG: hypothetical protein N2111_14315 [Candidatus Sumerlaeaceae bacterium]|nr:hypothetical protein [Candidatus Sumerlaeaceae bacterium]